MQLLQALGTGRVGAAAVTVDDCVYVLGGKTRWSSTLGGQISSHAFFKSVEILDLNDMHSWRKGVDMLECRADHAAAFMNGSSSATETPNL